MKTKTIRALAAAGAATLAPLATAQSNVTLSGVVDLSVRYSRSASGHATTLASGGNSTSRLIFSGTEDLGGGLRAGFWLEGSLLADTGTGATGGAISFDRRSTVQLGGRWGKLRLGRTWTPVFWGEVLADPFVATGVGGMQNFLNAGVNTVYRRAFGLNPTTLSRSSNAIEYWLPDGLGGVYGQAMYGFSEKNRLPAGVQSANAQGSYGYQGLRLGWRNKNVDVAGYAGQTRIDATDAKLTQAGLMGAYTLDGGIRLALGVTNSRYLDSKQTHTVLSASVPWQQFVFKAAYNRLDQKGADAAGRSIDADDATSVTLGAEYFLSKRTLLYATVARIDNRGNAVFTVPNAPTLFVPGGRASRGYEFGVRTSF